MYEAHFGFSEKPFNLTPDPKYLYLSPRHADAFAHMEFGRRERGGFVVVTGEVGTGKTTLARYFLGQLGEKTATAVVLYPALTARELLRSILDDLHVESPGESMKDLVDALHRFLLKARAEERQVVLLIDEAQDLSTEVLEQVRLISNLETDTEKLITIVLMGQSELQEMLARRELRQLAQRVTARYHLAPLQRHQTEDYIRHRIEVAGGVGKVSFTTSALAGVHRHSGGLPRLVNLICDRALLAAYVDGTRTVTEAMTHRAAREVAGETPRSVATRRAWRAAGLVAAALVLVGVGAGVGQLAGFGDAGRVPRPVASPPAATPAPRPTPSKLGATLVSLDREASRDAALEAVRARWGGAPLSFTELQTHLRHLKRLDLPVVLEMFHPERRDTCFLALLALRGTSGVVSAGGELLEVPLTEIDAAWTRLAVFPWEPGAVGDDADPWVRARLEHLGHLAPGGESAEAVRRFQRDAELVPDGLVGPRTLLSLYGLAEPDRPRLAPAAGTEAGS